MKQKRFGRVDVVLWLVFIGLGVWMRSLDLGETLDQRLYYSAAQARAYFESLTPQSAAGYFKNEWIDLTFITVYSAILFRRLRSPLAFLPGFFDALETLTILLILTGALSPDHAGWMGTATFLKWTTGGAVVLKILIQAVSGTRSRPA